MEMKEKLMYLSPEATTVELQPGAALLQGSAVKQDYQDGGDIVWS